MAMSYCCQERRRSEKGKHWVVERGHRVCLAAPMAAVSAQLHHLLMFHSPRSTLLFSTPSLYIISFLRAFPHLDSPLTPMPANYWASLCDYLLHAAEGELRLRSGEEVRERASLHEKWLQSVPHCSETFGKAVHGCVRVCVCMCVCEKEKECSESVWR